MAVFTHTWENLGISVQLNLTPGAKVLYEQPDVLAGLPRRTGVPTVVETWESRTGRVAITSTPGARGKK